MEIKHNNNNSYYVYFPPSVKEDEFGNIMYVTKYQFENPELFFNTILPAPKYYYQNKMFHKHPFGLDFIYDENYWD